MASLLLAAGALSYTAIKKRKARKNQRTTAFSDLERENAARIAHLQTTTCFCQRSDWRGGGCEDHGYVPAAGEVGGPPAYVEEEAQGVERRGTIPPEYLDANSPHAHVSPYQYRRGREDGWLADQPGGVRVGSDSAVDAVEGGRGGSGMREEEVRRINEERRKRMKAGGFTNFMLRWRRERAGKGEGGAVR